MHASMQFHDQRRRLQTCLVGALLLALSACASTQLVDRWGDPGYQGPALHKVLVVGVQRNQGRRRIWQDSMVAALTRLGVAATASYRLFRTRGI